MSKYCPICFVSYPQSAEKCEADGTPLIVPLERDLTGEVLDDRYTILGAVGRGGMGVVYKAEQRIIGRTVALKVLRREIAQDATAVKRFLTEARAIASLSNPHTVTLHDFGVTKDGLLYYTMELLEGSSLAAIIHRCVAGGVSGALDCERAVALALQVCDSLEEAHDKGILHRDLKPDNVLVTLRRGREHAKVLDFGVAKVLSGITEGSVTRTGLTVGTPEYLSPEQAQGRAVTPASDIYSLAVVLYEMLVGVPPFLGESPMTTAISQVRDPVPRMADRRPGVVVPEAVEAVVRRALEKDPLARFQSAQAFRAALMTALREDERTTVEVSRELPSDAEEGDAEESPESDLDAASRSTIRVPLADCLKAMAGGAGADPPSTTPEGQAVPSDTQPGLRDDAPTTVTLGPPPAEREVVEPRAPRKVRPDVDTQPIAVADRGRVAARPLRNTAKELRELSRRNRRAMVAGGVAVAALVALLLVWGALRRAKVDSAPAEESAGSREVRADAPEPPALRAPAVASPSLPVHTKRSPEVEALLHARRATAKVGAPELEPAVEAASRPPDDAGGPTKPDPPPEAPGAALLEQARAAKEAGRLDEALGALRQARQAGAEEAGLSALEGECTKALHARQADTLIAEGKGEMASGRYRSARASFVKARPLAAEETAVDALIRECDRKLTRGTSSGKNHAKSRGKDKLRHDSDFEGLEID